jgi:hypothetical protein
MTFSPQIYLYNCVTTLSYGIFFHLIMFRYFATVLERVCFTKYLRTGYRTILLVLLRCN